LALVTVAATVAFLSVFLLGFALRVHLRQVSAKVTPEDKIELHDPPLKTVEGFPSPAKKPPKLKLDLEKAESVSEAWDQSSQPSTRCPSSRSSSTISVASSLASSYISRQSTHSQLALVAKPIQLPSQQLSPVGRKRDTAMSLTPTGSLQGARLHGGQIQQSQVMIESSRAPGRSDRRSSSLSVSSRQSSSSEGSSKSRSSRSSGPLGRHEQRKSHRTRSRQPSLARVQEQPELERPRGQRQF